MKKQVWAKIFGIILLLGWVFVGLIGTEIIVGLAISWLLPADVLASPVVNATFSVIAYILGLILIVLVPSKVPKVRELVKSTRERLGLKGLPTWTDLGLAPIGYIAAIALAAGLTALFSLFPWFNSSEAQNLGYSIYMQGWERGIAFVELAVFAPMIEELIFRGWLYGNLRIRAPKIVAILLISLLFGLVHMQWNVGVSVFAMSVVSCTLREITGTIYAGTLLHIINNVVAFYLVYVVGMG